LNVFNTPLNAIVSTAVALALLVVMPLALRLIDAPGVAVLARWWIPLSIPALVAMALPRGPLATALAAVYLLATLALAATAVARFLRNRKVDPWEIAAFTALVTPSIAASALVAERAGYELFGFGLGILRLTVPHMHFAGCVAALIAGLTGRAETARAAGPIRAAGRARATSAKIAAVTVPVGTGVVLGGYFIGDAVELLGAVILTGGMWLTAWLTLKVSATGATNILLKVSAATLAVTMVLAVAWALGEETGLPHPSLTWMAATHGLANAFGFALCAVLAWRRRAVSPL
jgi:hypothetical protein